MRYVPEPSVTTVCSPCMAGDVTVTTTSASGFLVAASTIVPVRTAVPWAEADPAVSRVTSAIEPAGRRWAARQRSMTAAQKPRFLSRRFTGSSLKGQDLDESDAPYTASSRVLSMRSLLEGRDDRDAIGCRRRAYALPLASRSR